MDSLIIVILIVVAAIFIYLYFIQREAIKYTTKQLKNINHNKTNSKVLISGNNKQIINLVIEINKNLEEKQKSEAQYKSMDLELRQAIANISHDLRTPLTSILGYIQLIEDDKLSGEEKKEYIDIVKNRSKALQGLITGFYDLSRLEAREYKFEKKIMSLADVLSDMLAAFYNDFVNKVIEPEVIITEEQLPVNADEQAVRRVFSNLIQNILNYGKHCASIRLQRYNGYMVTIFENDAPDLKQEDVPRIFERFFTGDRTRNGKGTGLGLAITKELVEQMGSTITASLNNRKLCIEIKWNVAEKDRQRT